RRRGAGAALPGGASMRPPGLWRVARAGKGGLQGGDGVVDAIATDSRTLLPGQGRPLFVASAGENFVGHDHVAAAAAAGAAAALVSRPAEVALPQVVVSDTVEAQASRVSALKAPRKRLTAVHN